MIIIRQTPASARISSRTGATLIRFAPRMGATLTEVLMSLLVMSIGIVSVITIFPISLLRSIQATQLTNARLLRQNAEETFRIPRRDTVLADGTYEVLSHSVAPGVTFDMQNFRGTWQPGTTYQNNQIVTPSRKAGQTTPVPNIFYVAFGLGCSVAGAGPGVSGFVEPNWSLTDEVVDGSMTWTPITPFNTPSNGGTAIAAESTLQIPLTYTNGAGSVAESWYSARNYVVDPMGWNVYHNEALDILVGSGGTTLASPNDFGFKVDKNTGIASCMSTAGRPFTSAPTTDPYLARLNGGATSIDLAQEIAAHADSWAVDAAYTGTPTTWATNTAGQVTSVTFLQGDYSTLNGTGFSRIVLTSTSNSIAIVRPILAAGVSVGAGGTTIAFNEPLPAGFVPDGVGRVETFDRRYTWMATVNKDIQGNAKTTVAVFFKRGFKPSEEHVYDASFGNTASGNALFTNASFLSADQVMIRWDPTAEPPPLLKPGNFVLDGRFAAWYRIVAVTANSTDVNVPPNFAILTVDRVVPTVQLTDFSLSSPGRAILMRGIVELFEL